MVVQFDSQKQQTPLLTWIVSSGVLIKILCLTEASLKIKGSPHQEINPGLRIITGSFISGNYSRYRIIVIIRIKEAVGLVKGIKYIVDQARKHYTFNKIIGIDFILHIKIGLGIRIQF